MEQIPLFPLETRVTRIDAARNTWRFYEMSVQHDLFGGAALIRRWGRIGTAGRLRLDLHTNEGAAANALACLLRRKIKRGYRWASTPT
ncbi:WGR domain-containing protein [Acetobacter okinawensis]|uniref:WGR domain-containing protein n=1 Tax=Acetobacter okinawensis TaxID=1076594 RepID=UPI0004725D33|nr:WGR domain-containing protein [Acetobacter okinawensis]